MSRKIYVVTAGADYYPRDGDGDWRGVFGNREDAEAFVEGIRNKRIVSSPYGLDAIAPEWVSVIEVDVDDLTFNGSTICW